MITKPEMYGVACDNCGHDHESRSCGFSCMSDENYMRDDAIDCGWHEIEDEINGDKHYCPKCFSIDDNDTVTILPTTKTQKDGNI